MKRLFIISFICFLASCQLVVEVDVPHDPPVLVINSVFTPDSAWLVSISASRYILDEHSFTQPASTLKLTDETGNQIELSPLSFNSGLKTWYQNAGGLYYRSSTRPVPGMTYRLDVTAPGFNSALAVATAPKQVEAFKVRMDSAHMELDVDGYYANMPVEIEFTDPPGSGDYYYPGMYMEEEWKYYDPRVGDTVRQVHQVYMYLTKKESESSDLLDLNEELEVVSDATFNGKHHVMRYYTWVPISNRGGTIKRMWFALGHTGPEYFRYLQSKRLQQSAQGNPLAEPVQVYTNVEGGLGIFAGFTVSKWEFME